MPSIERQHHAPAKPNSFNNAAPWLSRTRCAWSRHSSTLYVSPQTASPTRVKSARKRPCQDEAIKKPTKRHKSNDSSKVKAGGGTADASHWDEWDARRETHAGQKDQSGQSIKAFRVWQRLSSQTTQCTSKRQQDVSTGHLDTMVNMVMAVANGHAFGALKEVITFLQQGGGSTIADIFSKDPRILVRAVAGIETRDNLNSYLRRFALARLARLYDDTVANRGRLRGDKEDSSSSHPVSTNKGSKSEAYVSLFQHVWDVPFPARFRGKSKTQSGLIASDDPDAVRWNQCKKKLSRQIEAGQRWLRFANKFGWSALGLMTRDWSIGENKVLANDRTFGEVLTVSEHEVLLYEIESVKGRFLRRLNATLGVDLFDLLENATRAPELPLLHLDDQHILARPDCDQRWVDEFRLQPDMLDRQQHSRLACLKELTPEFGVDSRMAIQKTPWSTPGNLKESHRQIWESASISLPRKVASEACWTGLTPTPEEIFSAILKVLGKCRKLVAMWPLSDHNRQLLRQHSSIPESFVPLCQQLEAPYLDMLDASAGLFMQAGVIHATITIEGGILIGINTFSARSALASLRCFLYELEAKLEKDYASIFRLFTSQLKAMVGDVSISREFLRHWTLLCPRLNEVVRDRKRDRRLNREERAGLQDLSVALLAVVQQEEALPETCRGGMSGIRHFQEMHLLVAR
ncbi:hypothetical protein LTR40_002342 [Exophiala xenobiotica]|nr:hypothetical protein LTR40_002342 [Exophiala xenobiotica]